jgi:hypothetical protein
VVGADWGERMLHIKAHWHDGGSRFTKTHPWSSHRSTLGETTVNHRYFQHLDRGKDPQEFRPPEFYFHGYGLYEGAMMHRARLKIDTDGLFEPSTAEWALNQALQSRLPLEKAKPMSFLAAFKSKSKPLLSFFRAR